MTESPTTPKMKPASKWAHEIDTFVIDNIVKDDGEYILYNCHGLIKLIKSIQEDAINANKNSNDETNTR